MSGWRGRKKTQGSAALVATAHAGRPGGARARRQAGSTGGPPRGPQLRTCPHSRGPCEAPPSEGCAGGYGPHGAAGRVTHPSCAPTDRGAVARGGHMTRMGARGGGSRRVWTGPGCDLDPEEAGPRTRATGSLSCVACSVNCPRGSARAPPAGWSWLSGAEANTMLVRSVPSCSRR